jgi:hypothetical protein
MHEQFLGYGDAEAYQFAHGSDEAHRYTGGGSLLLGEIRGF